MDKMQKGPLIRSRVPLHFVPPKKEEEEERTGSAKRHCYRTGTHVHGFSLLYRTRWDLNTDWLVYWQTGTDRTVDTPKWLHWSGDIEAWRTGTSMIQRRSELRKLWRLVLLASIHGVEMQASIFSSASVLAFLHGPRCWKFRDGDQMKWATYYPRKFHLNLAFCWDQ